MWFLGIDIGTTHIKVIGQTAEGEMLPAMRSRTPVVHDRGLVWHDADAVWRAVVDLTVEYAGSVAHGPLAGVAVASFGQEEAVGVGADGNPTNRSLAWWQTFHEPALDADTVAWLDSREHYARSGLRYRSMQSPERIAQLRRDEPRQWRRTVRWADFGAFVGFRLSGRWATSATQLNHSQLFQVRDLSPDPAAVERLDVDPALFPEAAAVGSRLGDLRTDVLPGVPRTADAGVFVGGHDQVLAAFACATLTGADAFDSIGTSEYLMLLADDVDLDSSAYDGGIDVERGWTRDGLVIGRAIPSGKAIETLARLLDGGDFDAFFHHLADGDGTGGVTVHINDPGAEHGGLVDVLGVDDSTAAGEVARAGLDALAMLSRESFEQMQRLTGRAPAAVAVLGSLFQREAMLAHRRRRWDLPLTLVGLDEPVATGAAAVARSAVLGRAEIRTGNRTDIQTGSRTDIRTEIQTEIRPGACA